MDQNYNIINKVNMLFEYDNTINGVIKTIWKNLLIHIEQYDKQLYRIKCMNIHKLFIDFVNQSNYLLIEMKNKLNMLSSNDLHITININSIIDIYLQKNLSLLQQLK